MLLTGLGILATACGSASQPSGSAASPQPMVSRTPSIPPAAASSAASPSAPAAAVPLCPATSLRGALGAGGAAAGSSYYPIQLTNSSGRSCTLYGYPGVSFVSAPGGSQIGAAAVQNPAMARRIVTLAPGATASALLQVADARNYPAASCKPVAAHWLQVFPPGQQDALNLKYSGLTCSAQANSVHVLGIETIQPGKTGQ